MRFPSPFGLPRTAAVRVFLWFVVIGNVLLGGLLVALCIFSLVVPDEDTPGVPGLLLGLAIPKAISRSFISASSRPATWDRMSSANCLVSPSLAKSDRSGLASTRGVTTA